MTGSTKDKLLFKTAAFFLVKKLQPKKYNLLSGNFLYLIISSTYKTVFAALSRFYTGWSSQLNSWHCFWYTRCNVLCLRMLRIGSLSYTASINLMGKEIKWGFYSIYNRQLKIRRHIISPVKWFHGNAYKSSTQVTA